MRAKRRAYLNLAAAILAVCCGAAVATAQTPAGDADQTEAATPEWYSLHAQFTNVTQYHPPFSAALQGPNSMSSGHNGRETSDATLFAGIRVWDGLELYANPEIDQGFGLSNTTGAAGFPSGEAYKVGAVDPYVRLHRAFARYTLGLGGADQAIEPAANQLAGTRREDNLTVTLGKFAVTDIFDTNAYAHDPKSDFLNWSIIDTGTFDYAADAWGYSYGAAVEWTQAWWSLRGGLFNLSRVPNSKDLNRGFEQFEIVLEGEARHTLFGRDGKLKLLVFANRGRMANYSDAVRAAAGTGAPPDVSTVRRYATRPGVGLNLEQQITDELGGFLRAGLNDGHKEAYEFTEINRTAAAGLALEGKSWGRPDDTLAVAGVLNDISKDARNYLAAGGIGILIGDGALPRAGFEKILELYYKAAVVEGVAVTLDLQRIENPGYNAARGPVNVVGLRLHAEL